MKTYISPTSFRIPDCFSHFSWSCSNKFSIFWFWVCNSPFFSFSSSPYKSSFSFSNWVTFFLISFIFCSKFLVFSSLLNYKLSFSTSNYFISFCLFFKWISSLSWFYIQSWTYYLKSSKLNSYSLFISLKLSHSFTF
jgi:hypothetical protein